MAGTIKLIFQPAEGVRGARAMVAKGIVDDVDYMFGGHIGFKATKSDSLVCLTGGFWQLQSWMPVSKVNQAM